MTGHVLSTPISPVTAAALAAGITDWLVSDLTTECADCAADRATRQQCPTCTWGVVLGVDDEMPCPDCGGACFVEVLGVVPAHLTGDCPTCDGTGRVPVVVEVGDTLTVPISNELPDEGTKYGDVHFASLIDGMLSLCRVDHGRWVHTPLRPGGSLSGTVAAIPDSTTAALPIVVRTWPQEGHGDCLTVHPPDADSYPRLIRWRDGQPDGECINAELAWQDFTPDSWAVRLTDVTVTS